MMEKLFRSLIIGALLPLSVMAKPGNGALEFVANKGQWEGPFLYKAATGNGQVFLERNTFTYVTVSYTHLDVYKRQTSFSLAEPGSIRCFNLSIKFMKRPEKKPAMKANTMIPCPRLVLSVVL